MTSTEIHITNDDGVSWSSQQIIEFPENDIFSINGQFVFFARSNNNVYISDDGISWNVFNYGYKIFDYLETSTGLIAVGQNVIFKIGADLSQVTDTIRAIREDLNGFKEELGNAIYILNSENEYEAFGFFSDSISRPTKGISADGGESWTFESFNLPMVEGSPNEIRFPYYNNDIQKYGDNLYC